MPPICHANASRKPRGWRLQSGEGLMQSCSTTSGTPRELWVTGTAQCSAMRRRQRTRRLAPSLLPTWPWRGSSRAWIRTPSGDAKRHLRMEVKLGRALCHSMPGFTSVPLLVLALTIGHAALVLPCSVATQSLRSIVDSAVASRPLDRPRSSVAHLSSPTIDNAVDSSAIIPRRIARQLLRRDAEFLDARCALAAFLWATGDNAGAESEWEALQQSQVGARLARSGLQSAAAKSGVFLLSAPTDATRLSQDGLGGEIYPRAKAVDRVRTRWPPRATAALSAFLNVTTSGEAMGYDGALQRYEFGSQKAA